jgi:hypothetical protein
MWNTKFTKRDDLNKQDTHGSEGRPDPSDIDALGTWLVERDREILDMLSEFDRRKEERNSIER